MQNLWSYIPRGTTLRHKALATGDLFRKSKISNLDIFIISLGDQQKVLRFQITMRDTLGVNVIQSLEQNLTDIPGLFFIVECLGYNSIKELASKHEFCHEVVVCIFIKYFIEGDNVNVVYVLEDSNFVFEGIFIFLCQFGLGHDFGSVYTPIASVCDPLSQWRMHLLRAVIGFEERESVSRTNVNVPSKVPKTHDFIR